MKITISNPSTPPAPKEIKFPAVYEGLATGIIFLFFDDSHCISISKSCFINVGVFYENAQLSPANYKPRPDISVTFHAENE